MSDDAETPYVKHIERLKQAQTESKDFLEALGEFADEVYIFERSDELIACNAVPFIFDLFRDYPNPEIRLLTAKMVLNVSARIINHIYDEKWGVLLEIFRRRSREWIGITLSILPKKSVKNPEVKTDLEYTATSLLMNTSEIEELKGLLNAEDVVDRLLPLTPRSLLSAIAVANLAGNLPDEVNNQIVVENRLIPRLMAAFVNSLAGKPDPESPSVSMALDYWPEEAAMAITSLCQNDKNKVLLADAGAIPLLVRVLKQENMPKYEGSSVQAQRFRSARALWQLAFKTENHKKLIDAGVVEALRDLRDCKSKELADDAGKRAAYGALLQLGKQEREAESKVGTGGHIMLSYNWASQALAISIRDTLENFGFKVWLDLNEMQGSTLEAMAQAVEACSAFLMFMSQGYKSSPNCRAEAEYAFQLRKPIVPVLVEAGYKADGWMGAILGSKLWYDFSPALSKGSKGETKVDGGHVARMAISLSKELERHAQASGSPKPAAVTPVASPVVVEQKEPAYLKWTAPEVAAWVTKLGFSQAKVFIEERMTGIALDELRKLRQENADTQLTYLEKRLRFKHLGDALSFSRHLQQLSNE